jgi:hypothetical protein
VDVVAHLVLDENDAVAVAKKQSIALVVMKLDLAMHLEMVVMN